MAVYDGGRGVLLFEMFGGKEIAKGYVVPTSRV